ncbi:MAG: RsmE family RNA methyltransferase [Kofleriaceae bacterium]
MRIFVAELHAGELEITGDEHFYVGHVRRARVGDELELVDGAGHRARATITAISDAATTVTAGDIETVVEAPPHVRVLVPLIKGDRMDLCLEKLVEVGANELIVWRAERSIVKLDPAKRDARLAHYLGVAEAAARQCGRATMPAVTMAATLREILRALPAGDRFVLDPSAERAATRYRGDVTLASGPEGGLAPIELEQLEQASFASLGLGPRILRAETAPVVAVALIRAATAS